MTLRQLRYVVAIADRGLSITAAADWLCTSQPGISKQLKLLEERLGFEIFVRNGKSLTQITAPGHEIVARARVIVREADAIRHLCRDFAEGECCDPSHECSRSVARGRST